MGEIDEAALVAAQLVAAAQPAAAADLAGAQAESPQRGGFAGARLLVPFGGSGERVRAGLALVPMSRVRETGAVRMTPGLELSVSTAGRLEFAAAGRELHFNEQRKAGVSTLGWVAIGVGALLVVTAVAAASAYAEIIGCDDSDECS
jgi:hypothetical protein